MTPPTRRNAASVALCRAAACGIGLAVSLMINGSREAAAQAGSEAGVGGGVVVGPAAAGSPDAGSPEAWMADYQALCSVAARQDAARIGTDQALARGRLCADLARRIQATAEAPATGAAASPLARPDPTVWRDAGPALPPPGR